MIIPMEHYTQKDRDKLAYDSYVLTKLGIIFTVFALGFAFYVFSTTAHADWQKIIYSITSLVYIGFAIFIFLYFKNKSPYKR